MVHPAAVLLHVTGLEPKVLRSQSLANLWAPEEDGAEHLLAHAQFTVGGLRDDVLERLTWALLAWPEVDQLHLYERTSGRQVAIVIRSGAAETGAQKRYQWCDSWLQQRPGPGGSGNHDRDKNRLTPFPPAQGLRAGRGVTFVHRLAALDEEALAIRERVKHRLQRFLGRRGTAFLHRCWRGFRPVLKSRGDIECSVDNPAAKVLTAIPSTVCRHPESPGVLMMLPRLSPGGAEKSAIDLAMALMRQRVPVHMITTFGSTNTWSERARSAGARVWHLPDFLPAGCWLTFLDSYISRHAIAVVHLSNSHWTYDNLAALKALHPGLRVVTQLHAEGDRGELDYPAQSAQQDQYVDCQTVISSHLAIRLVRKHDLDPGKIRIVRTGIDLDREFSYPMRERGSWRRRQGIDTGTPLVAFVGRFSDLKRPLIFLAMAKLVLERRPATHFVMKGDGPLLAQVQKYLSRNRELAKVTTIEDSRSAVVPLMADADLLVLTSAMEGVAYVSYEAMALGLVPVSADVGAQSELITPESGVLVPIGRGEVERFAKEVCSLLADDDRRASLSAGALARIRQWSTVDDMARAYLDVYGLPVDPGNACGLV